MALLPDRHPTTTTVTDADLRRWFRRPPRRTSHDPARAEVPTLVILPHAGGSASAFTRLVAALEPRLRTITVQYPGRQDRLGEPHFGSIDRLVGTLADLVPTAVPGRLALFGHSMGATVAYELARTLAQRGREPEALIVSGRRAPSTSRPGTGRSWSDEAILAELGRRAGADAELLADPEVREMILPPLRGDYAAVDAYRHRAGHELTCPVIALAGAADPHVTLPDVHAWAEHTSGSASVTVLPGGHFFYEDSLVEVADTIMGALGDLPTADRDGVRVPSGRPVPARDAEGVEVGVQIDPYPAGRQGLSEAEPAHRRGD